MLLNLPNELLFYIFTFTDLRDLYRLLLCSKQTKIMVDIFITWKHKVCIKIFCKYQYFDFGSKIIHGKFIEYYDAKNTIIERSTEYVNGYKHGYEIEFYKSGALLSTSTYVNGKRHGICKTYYNDGRLNTLACYNYDNLHGVYYEYCCNGKVRREVNYYMGRRHGLETIYWECYCFGWPPWSDGYHEDKLCKLRIIYKSIMFDNDIKIYEKTYNKSGNIDKYTKFKQ